MSPDWEEIHKQYSIPTIVKQKDVIPFLCSTELSDIFNGKSVLDAGCGPGHIAQSLLEKHQTIASYIGVDVSESAVQFAKTLEINSKLQPKFDCFDVISLPFSDSMFDTVLSINVIPLVSTEKDLKKLIWQSNRVLKTNGNFLLITVNDKAVLSSSANDTFQFALLNKTSEPIKYKARQKKIDGTFLEFHDLCWRANIVQEELQLAGFSISAYGSLHDRSEVNTDESFIFFKANKIG